ncbi:MAG: D-aminoacylase [Thermoanaerobaculales bacterium]|jgi:N-acyl-D-amino-acid deacylase|nr:D-aminoacylase [Thermoanaerobaculales bacterium]
MKRLALICSLLLFAGCGNPTEYDMVLRGGTIYDGTGSPGVVGDIAIDGDTIVAVGDLDGAVGQTEIDVEGLAVAPGFINMLSWATSSLIADGRAQSDIRQGVTLEVMGEGNSMGPLTEEMKAETVRRQGDIKYDIEWTTLDEYLVYLENRGVSPNVASFLGAATPRKHAIGYEDRAPTAEELDHMRAIVRTAMEEGAMGLASALIYPPGSFAQPDELEAMAEIVAEHDGMYISHVRGEGRHLVEAVGELVDIARLTGVTAEIYHFKASGQKNWPLFDEAVALVDAARAEGIAITADVYTYPAGATGLNASMPPWVQEGGFDASVDRLKDPRLRQRIAREMLEDSDDWENMYLGAGSPDNILLVGFKNPELKKYTGMSLGQVAAERGVSPEITAMDLIVEDNSRVTCVYFSQSEDVLRKAVALPWVSFCSDESAPAIEGIFLKKNNHPRAYGSFARVLAKYVRDEGVITIEEAVRKLSGLPAANLKLDRRGLLQEGYFADVVVFDPSTIQDHATFTEPHQYATGVHHVFVNGEQVLADGEHTGATPGRVVRGPGWTGRLVPTER